MKENMTIQNLYDLRNTMARPPVSYTHLYMRATRDGVSKSPSRSGSSPTASKISRTARSILSKSIVSASFPDESVIC